MSPRLIRITHESVDVRLGPALPVITRHKHRCIARLSPGKDGDQSGTASWLPPRRKEADTAPRYNQERGGLRPPVLTSPHPRWHLGGECQRSPTWMLNHSHRRRSHEHSDSLVHLPQSSDPHERERRWEPVPRQASRSHTAHGWPLSKAHQQSCAKMAASRQQDERWVGSRRCELDARAKRCQMNTSSPLTVPRSAPRARRYSD